MNYDDSGNLVLSGKLGEAVVNNDFEAFTKAQISGKSEDGLTYQDMADFNEFVSEFFRLGEFPGRNPGGSHTVVLRKTDQAPFGLSIYDSEIEVEPELAEWVFKPVQPFTIQGYEPA